MTIFALVDCNNFYASCERIFNPRMEGKPIIVLSNNDGCVIARSKEAKQIKIPMGAPFYQWSHLCDKQKLFAFSSNYALYGDISNRVMTTLESFCPDIEMYSIDEAFLQLESFQHMDLVAYAIKIKKSIKSWLSMPISIGIGPTKTLAKIANKIAKKNSVGVFDLRDDKLREKILIDFSVKDIWGIGRGYQEKLMAMNIHTAKQLRDADLSLIRKRFGVVLEKTVRELRGVSCLPLELIVSPKKQIISSRSFGKLLTEQDDIAEAVSHYAAKACAKLRSQNSLAGGMAVFLNTNYFREQDAQYGNTISLHFPEPTCDTGKIITSAKKCLQKIFRKGFRYKKAGVMLMDISLKQHGQLDLFSENNKNEELMQTVDLINKKFGKNTLFLCAEGTLRTWQTRCQRKSPCFTTRIEELAQVLCV